MPRENQHTEEYEKEIIQLRDDVFCRILYKRRDSVLSLRGYAPCKRVCSLTRLPSSSHCDRTRLSLLSGSHLAGARVQISSFSPIEKATLLGGFFYWRRWSAISHVLSAFIQSSHRFGRLEANHKELHHVVGSDFRDPNVVKTIYMSRNNYYRHKRKPKHHNDSMSGQTNVPRENLTKSSVHDIMVPRRNWHRNVL